MLSWKNIRYQNKLLILFFLLSSIPALIIGAIGYQKSSDMLLRQNKQDLDVILVQLNSSIERQINDFDRFSMLPYFMPELFSYLNKPSVSPDQWSSEELKAQRSMIRLMSAYPSINSSINGLIVYGMNGTRSGYRYNGELAINIDAEVTNEQWYKDVLEAQGGFVVTGLNEVNQFINTPFQAIIGSRLLMDEDYRPLAVTAIFISPEFISKIVSALELRNVQVTVLDKKQELIYTSDPRLAEQQRTMHIGQKKGEWESELVSEVGERTYSGVFLKSGYLDWTIYMGIDRDEMLQGSRSIRNFTYMMIIGIAILAAMISWLLARGLSKPIYRLIRSMRRVEKGQFSAPVSFDREDEIGQLEISYSRMVQRLNGLVQSIEEKERQKRHAELRALRAQIQPHFLYNTLNSIRMLAIIQQSDQIAKLIQSLNKLLHANMKLDGELVTLEDEIRLLKEYTSLMDLRYTNIFEVRWLIPEMIQQAAIPPMLLQPLIENAIFHGAKGMERKLDIVIEASLNTDERNLIIEIRDDGAGFPDSAIAILNETSSPDIGHIGLRNVQDRIRLRFGEEYGITLKRVEYHTVIRLTMPYRVVGEGRVKNVEPTGS